MQVYDGQKAGVESAFHSMADIFKSNDSAAILTADASNAFDNLNRNLFLHSFKIICLEILNLVINRYNSQARLLAREMGESRSQKGTN